MYVGVTLQYYIVHEEDAGLDQDEAGGPETLGLRSEPHEETRVRNKSNPLYSSTVLTMTFSQN